MTAFLDSPARAVESFWVAVTGAAVSARRGPGGEFATLVPAGGDACVRVQETGSGSPGVHLDMHVTDVGAGAAEAVGLGASVVSAEEGLTVLRSPAGLVFCLVSWHGERVVPEPVRWPGGQSSVLDQVSLDVPDALYDAEVAFWVALTGWEFRRANRPEFGYLVRAGGMPLRLLLQRVGSAVAGMHVDFACDGVDAEVARHVGCGAVVVRRVPRDWTTLRDPAGREYCVTARSPVR